MPSIGPHQTKGLRHDLLQSQVLLPPVPSALHCCYLDPFQLLYRLLQIDHGVLLGKLGWLAFLTRSSIYCLRLHLRAHGPGHLFVPTSHHYEHALVPLGPISCILRFLHQPCSTLLNLLRNLRRRPWRVHLLGI